ncbi:hypothetical protein ColTof4_14463 [Colletotrichum tofieldiae]|nr:hypothetical protein ColTof3_14813 [Colletotrichum tofieldiae]GKT82040.1 hypothetical protein ColTof4_14463 [Colletotrichum tofieldiae]
MANCPNMISDQSRKGIRLMLKIDLSIDDTPLSPKTITAINVINAIAKECKWGALDISTQLRIREIKNTFPVLFNRCRSVATTSGLSGFSRLPETPSHMPQGTQ